MIEEHIFLNKSLFFPKEGILVIGDLHIGYEEMLRQEGFTFPTTQIKEIIEDLEEIFKEINNKNLVLNKLIFIGDIKHHFGFEYGEKKDFWKIFDLLKQSIPEENIIFIKGNHDTIDFSYGKMKPFYIENSLAFIHGDILHKEILDKKIKTIVIGHLHPSVILSDKQGIKREKYKCFLIGKWKRKEIIILPSFLNIIEGQTINEYKESYEYYFPIIPEKVLMNFKVFVIGENKTYAFRKLKDLI